MKIYSQHDDQNFILAHFGSYVGRFLDIGAFDGIKYSNTYALVLNGWSGVSLEPEDNSYAALVQNLKGYPVNCVKKGLGERDGTVDFYDSNGGAISTTELDHVRIWEKAKATFVKKSIEVITWQTLRATYGGDFDFINIDTEGTSLRLFKLMPLAQFPNLKMICVEHDDKPEQVALLGFRVLHITPLNVILVRQ